MHAELESKWNSQYWFHYCSVLAYYGIFARMALGHSDSVGTAVRVGFKNPDKVCIPGIIFQQPHKSTKCGSTLQPWMLQCHWHWSIPNCRFDAVTDTGASMVAGLTLEHPWLQGWHCHGHWSIHGCRADTVTDTGTSMAAGWHCHRHWNIHGCRLTLSQTLEHPWLQVWCCHRHWSIHGCRVDTGASMVAGLTLSRTLEHPWLQGRHCHRHWNIHGCRLTLSQTLEHPWLQGWHCHRHWSIHGCRVEIDTVTDTGASMAAGLTLTDTGASMVAGLTLSQTLEHPRLQSWHRHWSIHGCRVDTVRHWSIHGCRFDSVTDTGASVAAGLTLPLTLEHPWL